MAVALEQIAQYAGIVPALRPAASVQAGLGTALQALRDVEFGFAVSDEIKDRHGYQPDDGRQRTEYPPLICPLSSVLCSPLDRRRYPARRDASCRPRDNRHRRGAPRR